MSLNNRCVFDGQSVDVSRGSSVDTWVITHDCTLCLCTVSCFRVTVYTVKNKQNKKQWPTMLLFSRCVSHLCLCRAVNRASLAAAEAFISCRKQSSWQLFRSFSLSQWFVWCVLSLEAATAPLLFLLLLRTAVTSSFLEVSCLTSGRGVCLIQSDSAGGFCF